MDMMYDALLERLAALLPAANRLTRHDLIELIRAVEVLAIERPSPDQLWTLARVAMYLGIDQKQAGRLLRGPGAPSPLGESLWRAGDIYRWLDTRQRVNLRVVSTR